MAQMRPNSTQRNELYRTKENKMLHTIRARLMGAESPICLARDPRDARLAVYRELAIVERHGDCLAMSTPCS